MSGNATDNEMSIDRRSVAEHAQDLSAKPIEPEEKPSGNRAGIDSGLWNGNALPDCPLDIGC